jgi:hypothetical protein
MRPWGLHLVDSKIALGSLTDIVDEQARSFRKEKERHGHHRHHRRG